MVGSFIPILKIKVVCTSDEIQGTPGWFVDKISYFINVISIISVRISLDIHYFRYSCNPFKPKVASKADLSRISLKQVHAQLHRYDKAE